MFAIEFDRKLVLPFFPGIVSDGHCAVVIVLDHRFIHVPARHFYFG